MPEVAAVVVGPNDVEQLAPVREALEIHLDERRMGGDRETVRVSVLVLSDADVRELLDMESCVAAMEDALAALARDELSMPLRSVFRPPPTS